jgi:hypothetical protein
MSALIIIPYSYSIKVTKIPKKNSKNIQAKNDFGA